MLGRTLVKEQKIWDRYFDSFRNQHLLAPGAINLITGNIWRWPPMLPCTISSPWVWEEPMNVIRYHSLWLCELICQKIITDLSKITNQSTLGKSRGRLSGWAWPNHTSPLKTEFSLDGNSRASWRDLEAGEIWSLSGKLRVAKTEGVMGQEYEWTSSYWEQPWQVDSQEMGMSVLYLHGAEFCQREKWA